MFTRDNATPQVLDLMQIVNIELGLLGQNTQTPAHVVLSYMVKPTVGAARILAQYNPSSVNQARETLRDMHGKVEGPIHVQYFTDSMKRIFKDAQVLAFQDTRPAVVKVTTDHLLRAILQQHDPNTIKFLAALNVNPKQVYDALKKFDGPLKD